MAVNSDNAANRWRKLAYALTSGVSLNYVMSRLRNRGERADIAGNLKRHLPEQEFRGTTHTVEHHLCHLASAFLVSPYDKAVAVSVDGFGDFSSAAWGWARAALCRSTAGSTSRIRWASSTRR